MAIKVSEANDGRVLEVEVGGRLAHEDYAEFVPAFERLVKRHGKISVLFSMVDFHGWTASALWDDLKFDFKHFADIDRLAMVGDRKWEQGMSAFCRPFTSATIRLLRHHRAGSGSRLDPRSWRKPAVRSGFSAHDPAFLMNQTTSSVLRRPRVVSRRCPQSA